jgi:NADH dehydrogenase FAD-containing subunit
MSTEAQNKSEEYLKQLGVTLMNNTRVDAYDGENVTYTTELLFHPIMLSGRQELPEIL